MESTSCTALGDQRIGEQFAALLNRGQAIAASPKNAIPCLDTPLLPPDGTLVERQLLALQNVPIASAALARTAGNDSVQTTRLELPLNRRLDLARRLVPLGLLLLGTLALLRLLLWRTLLLLPTPADRLAVVCLVPLPERRRVDLHHRGLGQGVCAHELVVGRMEGDDDDTHFARDALGAPREVAGVDAQAAELAVAAAGAHEMDALGADAGVGGLAALLESSGHNTSASDALLGDSRVMHTSSCDSMRAWHQWRCACDASHERYWQCVSVSIARGVGVCVWTVPHGCGWW